MERSILEKIKVLHDANSVTPESLTNALNGSDRELWQYLVSNTLWGGSGSMADQSLLEFPDARKELEGLLFELGQKQIELGRTNVRTEMWVSFFEKLLHER